MAYFANCFNELYCGKLNYVGVSVFRGKNSLKNSVLLGYSHVLLSRQIPKTQRCIPGDLNLQQHQSTDLMFPKHHAYFDSLNQQAIIFFTAPQETRYRQFYAFGNSCDKHALKNSIIFKDRSYLFL